MARKLIVEIVGDASSLQKALGQSSTHTNKFSGALAGMAKAGVVAAGAAGVGALFYTLKAGIGEWKQSQEVAAQTRAVLESTGAAAHVTAGDVAELATALMKKTGIDDEVIASGENLLLTFTSIRNEVGKGNDIFTQATKTITDMSVALGQDMKSSAIQVGKALQDPTKGMTALRRVGVAFTNAQQAQIKALDASGHKLEAQKLILRELNKEFGGSAEAAGKTLPGQINILRESFNNWAGDMVGKMIPVLERLAAWFNTNWPAIRDAIIHVWQTDIKPTFEAFYSLADSIVTVIRDHWGTIGPIVEGVGKVIEDTLRVITGTLRVFAALLRGDWSEAWTQLKNTIGAAVDGIKTIVTTELTATVNVFGGLAGQIKNAFLAGWDKVESAILAPFKALRQAAIGPLGSIVGAFRDLPGELRGAISAGAGAIVAAVGGLAKSIASTFSNIGEDIKAPVRNAINAISGFVDDAFGAATRLGGAVKRGFLGGMEGMVQAIRGLAKAGINALISAWNAFHIPGFHIHIGIPGPIPDIDFDTPSINFPDIPFLAKGGIVTGPTLAMLGESGREAVVPLGRGGGMGDTYNISFPNYVGDKRELVEVVRQGLLEIGRRNGTSLGQYA